MGRKKKDQSSGQAGLPLPEAPALENSDLATGNVSRNGQADKETTSWYLTPLGDVIASIRIIKYLKDTLQIETLGQLANAMDRQAVTGLQAREYEQLQALVDDAKSHDQGELDSMVEATATDTTTDDNSDDSAATPTVAPWRDRPIQEFPLNFPAKTIDYLTTARKPPVLTWGQLKDEFDKDQRNVFMVMFRSRAMEVFAGLENGKVEAAEEVKPTAKPAPAEKPSSGAEQVKEKEKPKVKETATAPVTAIPEKSPTAPTIHPAIEVPPSPPATAPAAVVTYDKPEEKSTAANALRDRRAKRMLDHVAGQWDKVNVVHHGKLIIVSAVDARPAVGDELKAHNVILETELFVWTAADLDRWFVRAHEYAADNVCDLAEAIEETMPENRLEGTASQGTTEQAAA